MSSPLRPAARLWNLVQEERSEVTIIYFYAILGGFIQLSLPLGIQAIIGFILGGTLSASLVVLISIIVIAVLCNGLIQLGQMQVTERLQQRIFGRYAFAFADRIPKLDLRKVDPFYLPELVNRFFDTGSLQKGLSKILLEIPTATIQIVFGLILLSFYHSFFILFSVVLLLLLWLILLLTGSKGLNSSLTESRHKYAVAAWLEETARLGKIFKIFSTTGLHMRRTDEKTILYLQARTVHFKVLLLQYKTLIFFKVVTTAAMLIIGVMLLLRQQINIGQFIAAEIIIITIINAVEKMIIHLDSVYDVLTAIEKLNKLIEKPIEKAGSFAMEEEGGMTIEAKELSYELPRGLSVLPKLSFDIGKGEKISITGGNGLGKTILLQLLSGMYNDYHGELSINKLPVANYSLPSLREKIGILFQQETIFHGSVWDNISMGRDNICKSYIKDLSAEIGLQSYISSLPNGYDTELGPAGKGLPENAIRKIALLRALAHKPALLVMEEPWTHIDQPYRQNIQNILLGLSGTTVIVATNDQNFTTRCHQVIQL